MRDVYSQHINDLFPELEIERAASELSYFTTSDEIYKHAEEELLGEKEANFSESLDDVADSPVGTAIVAGTGAYIAGRMMTPSIGRAARAIKNKVAPPKPMSPVNTGRNIEAVERMHLRNIEKLKGLGPNFEPALTREMQRLEKVRATLTNKEA